MAEDPRPWDDVVNAAMLRVTVRKLHDLFGTEPWDTLPETTRQEWRDRAIAVLDAAFTAADAVDDEFEEGESGG